MKQYLAIDIGGNSIKVAIAGDFSFLPCVKSWNLPHPEDWQNFPSYIKASISITHLEQVAVSSAGYIDSKNGVVKSCTIAGWVNYPLASEIDKTFNTKKRTVVINDADAHFFGNGKTSEPLICIALGTSPALAVSHGNGSLVRDTAGFNLDIGDRELATSASRREAWWALGVPGFREAVTSHGEARGAIRFGHRLGNFIANTCFKEYGEKPVVLSGGLMESYRTGILYGCMRELDDLGMAEIMAISASPYPGIAALVGAGRAACQNT